VTDIRELRRVQRRKRDHLKRVTLPCERCGRRIAWWDEQVRAGIAARDSVAHGWKWQGKRVPVRFRGPVNGRRWDFRSFPELASDDPRRSLSWLVDVECQSCGWSRDGVARQPDIWWLALPEIL
jgi:hypothetical protein